MNFKYIPYYLFVFLSLSIYNATKAQLVFRDQAPYSDSLELRMMMDKSFELADSLIGLKFNLVRMDILKIDNKKYLIPDGRFDVFEWTGTHWKNLYNKNFSGYNFSSRKFTFRGDLYSFGGYGFWRQHGDLIRFSRDRNEWEIVHYEDNYYPGNGISFTSDSSLYLLYPQFFLNGNLKYRVNEASLILNLNTMTFSSFSHPPMDNTIYSRSNVSVIETEHYALINNSPNYLYSKNENRFYNSDLSLYLDVRYILASMDYYVHSFGDVLVIRNRVHETLGQYDLAEVVTHFELMPVKKNNYFRYLIAIFILLLILSVFVGLYVRRKKNNSKDTSPMTFNHLLIPVLLKKSGTTIPVDIIDELLEISTIISAETQRYKRSVIINEINLEMKSRTGKKLILRLKDPEDKRRFLYRIG